MGPANVILYYSLVKAPMPGVITLRRWARSVQRPDIHGSVRRHNGEPFIFRKKVWRSLTSVKLINLGFIRMVVWEVNVGGNVPAL